MVLIVYHRVSGSHDTSPCLNLYFHRYTGVLWNHLAEHAEELWAKAGGGQPHGGQMGEVCFCPTLWAGNSCLPGGSGEYPSVSVGRLHWSFRNQDWTHFSPASQKRVGSLDSRGLRTGLTPFPSLDDKHKFFGWECSFPFTSSNKLIRCPSNKQ